MVLEYGLRLARHSLALEAVEMIIQRGRISPPLVSRPDKGNVQKWVGCLVQELAEQINSHLAWFFRMLKMSPSSLFGSSVILLESKSLEFLEDLRFIEVPIKLFFVVGRHVNVISSHLREEWLTVKLRENGWGAGLGEGGRQEGREERLESCWLHQLISLSVAEVHLASWSPKWFLFPSSWSFQVHFGCGLSSRIREWWASFFLFVTVFKKP